MRAIGGTTPTIDSTSDAYATAEQYVRFGCYRDSPSGDANGNNYYVNHTITWTSSCTRSGIGEGERNTQLLLETMGENPYVYPTYSKDNKGTRSEFYAAKLVDRLTYTYEGNTFSDWFIPSLDELTLMYQQLHLKGLGGFGSTTYVSSSECDKTNYSENNGMMYTLQFSDGNWNVVIRGNLASRVRPIRSF